MSAEFNAAQLLSDHFKTSIGDWTRIAIELRDTFMISDESLRTEKPASKFILTWMRELRAFQVRLSLIFGRKKQPPIADDFTAAVAFCLEQFLTARGHEGRVHCEKTTRNKRGATRPDVSIVTGTGSLVATIECKTNLGWSRKKWRAKCEARCEELLKSFPGCTPFMCVLTEKTGNQMSS